MVFYRESRSSELESRRRRNATTRAPIMTMITAIDSHRAFDPNGDDDVEDDESVSWEDPSLAFAEGGRRTAGFIRVLLRLPRRRGLRCRFSLVRIPRICEGN